MKKIFYPLLALLILAATLLACASPLGGGSSSDQVATVVAATFQALTPVTTDMETPIPAPVGLLPHALYFVNNDDTGIAQVFRLGTDGNTVTQLTFEPSVVGSYVTVVVVQDALRRAYFILEYQRIEWGRIAECHFVLMFLPRYA